MKRKNIKSNLHNWIDAVPKNYYYEITTKMLPKIQQDNFLKSQHAAVIPVSMRQMAELFGQVPVPICKDWYRVPFVQRATFQCETSECDSSIWTSPNVTYQIYLCLDPNNEFTPERQIIYLCVIAFS